MDQKNYSVSFIAHAGALMMSWGTDVVATGVEMAIEIAKAEFASNVVHMDRDRVKYFDIAVKYRAEDGEL